MTTRTFDSILSAATQAAKHLATTPTWQRAEWLNKVAEAISKDADDRANTIVTEGVKTIREAKSEVTRASLTFRLAASETGRDAGNVLALDRAPNGSSRFGVTLRRPLGVVLGITPFNDPLNLVAHKIAPAIAAGNAVIIKPVLSQSSAAYINYQSFERI